MVVCEQSKSVILEKQSVNMFYRVDNIDTKSDRCEKGDSSDRPIGQMIEAGKNYQQRNPAK